MRALTFLHDEQSFVGVVVFCFFSCCAGSVMLVRLTSKLPLQKCYHTLGINKVKECIKRCRCLCMLMERAAALAPHRMLISFRVNYRSNILMLNRHSYSMKHMTKKNTGPEISTWLHIIKVESIASHADLLAVVAQDCCRFGLNRVMAIFLFC